MAAVPVNGLHGWPSFGGMNRDSADNIGASLHTKSYFQKLTKRRIMADEIVKVPDANNDPEWTEIVEKLIEEMGDELPDKVIEATELMLCGWSTYQTAKKLGTSAKAVRSWLEKYPAMAMALKDGRAMLTKWRMSKLEQQFFLATEKSREILEADLTSKDINSRLAGVVGQHARFVMSLFMGQKVDVEIKVSETPQVKARNDALDYLAERMKALGGNPDSVIDASYTVVEPEKKTSGVPLLKENGDPYFGELGKVDLNEEGVLCHICGARSRFPANHIVGHKISLQDYSLVFMINKDDLKQQP